LFAIFVPGATKRPFGSSSIASHERSSARLTAEPRAVRFHRDRGDVLRPAVEPEAFRPRRNGLADLDEPIGEVLEELLVLAQHLEHRLEPRPRLLAAGLLARVRRVAEPLERDAVPVLEVLPPLPEELAVARVRLAVARRVELVVAAPLRVFTHTIPGRPRGAGSWTIFRRDFVIAAWSSPSSVPAMRQPYGLNHSSGVPCTTVECARWSMPWSFQSKR
jgi:hypothetical protein